MNEKELQALKEKYLDYSKPQLLLIYRNKSIKSDKAELLEEVLVAKEFMALADCKFYKGDGSEEKATPAPKAKAKAKPKAKVTPKVAPPEEKATPAPKAKAKAKPKAKAAPKEKPADLVFEDVDDWAFNVEDEVVFTKALNAKTDPGKELSGKITKTRVYKSFKEYYIKCEEGTMLRRELNLLRTNEPTNVYS